jgi:hypothetical protein
MVEVKSQRAKEILKRLQHFVLEKGPSMRKFPGELELWVELEWENISVKNLSFSGNLPDHLKILCESMASLVVGKKSDQFGKLSLRECEAFLRDRNSEASIEGMTESDEKIFKSLLSWLAHWPKPMVGTSYQFSSEKGPFKRLSLIEKIKEIKAFLSSSEILTLYKNQTRPELVDVDEVTIFVLAPYTTSEEKALFEELHLQAIATFQEESLNFIPEV